MKILATAIMFFSIAGSAFASRADPETVWHFPYKGIPYTTETPPIPSSVIVHHRTLRYWRAHRHPHRC